MILLHILHSMVHILHIILHILHIFLHIFIHILHMVLHILLIDFHILHIILHILHTVDHILHIFGNIFLQIMKRIRPNSPVALVHWFLLKSHERGVGSIRAAQSSLTMALSPSAGHLILGVVPLCLASNPSLPSDNKIVGSTFQLVLNPELL